MDRYLPRVYTACLVGQRLKSAPTARRRRLGGTPARPNQGPARALNGPLVFGFFFVVGFTRLPFQSIGLAGQRRQQHRTRVTK